MFGCHPMLRSSRSVFIHFVFPHLTQFLLFSVLNSIIFIFQEVKLVKFFRVFYYRACGKLYSQVFTIQLRTVTYRLWISTKSAEACKGTSVFLVEESQPWQTYDWFQPSEAAANITSGDFRCQWTLFWSHVATQAIQTMLIIFQMPNQPTKTTPNAQRLRN